MSAKVIKRTRSLGISSQQLRSCVFRSLGKSSQNKPGSIYPVRRSCPYMLVNRGRKGGTRLWEGERERGELWRIWANLPKEGALGFGRHSQGAFGTWLQQRSWWHTVQSPAKNVFLSFNTLNFTQCKGDKHSSRTKMKPRRTAQNIRM